MQGVNIVPTKLLHFTKNQPIHMCLYQEYLANEDYALFYRQQVASGKFVMLDNGAAEGCSPTIEELIPVYKDLMPSEVILPDIIGKRERTIEQARHAIEVLHREGLIGEFQICAVPQGENFAEWTRCLETLLEMPEITTIGISKFITKMYASEFLITQPRVAAIAEIRERTRDIQIHLLGCYYSTNELKDIEYRYPKIVRSTDSAIAYVYTRNGIKLDSLKQRPDQEEIHFQVEGDEIDQALLVHNLNIYLNSCK